MGQKRSANDALRAAQLNELRYDATTGVVIGIDGMLGPRGKTGLSGTPGPMGVCTELYVLSYAGLAFKVRLKPETFAMIEDATQLNGDELSFIKVVDESEWKSIREAWAEEWNKRRAYRAFDLGEMMPDE
ncbi:tail fiber protein [Pectobacterium phage PcCB7V]|nr:tail fiber protein [Pectobacterium phage PcCB7V]